MKSIKEDIYFNREKEDNWELEKKLEKKHFNTDNILYLGYEIQIKVELVGSCKTKNIVSTAYIIICTAQHI